MPEMHLKQPGCTYSAFSPFTKNKERIGKLKTQKKKKQEMRYIFTKINLKKPVFRIT